MKIHSASWGEEPFKFGVSSHSKLSNFFEIDSINLVIGKNGSGKTRMLERLCRVMSPNSPSFNEVSIDTGKHLRQLTGAEKKEIGVVYFTPLPYRRGLGKSRQFVDASPNYRDGVAPSDYEIFEKVANDLDIDTMLRGTVRFPQTDIENSIISAVMSGLLTFHDQAIERFAEQLRTTLKVTKLTTRVESSGAVYSQTFPSKMDPDTNIFSTGHLGQGSADDSDVLTNIKIDERRKFFSSFYELLIKAVGGEVLSIVILAALYQKTRTARAPRQLVMSLLNDLKLAHSNPPSDKARKEYQKLKSTIIYTEGILGTMPQLEVSDSVVSFDIVSRAQLEAVDLKHSIFTVEWSDLSSGLRALIDQFCCLRRSIDRLASQGARTVVVLIDEGDAYLHLDWQRKYVFLLDKFLGATKNHQNLISVQAVLATHSPVIASDFPNEMIYRLDAKKESHSKTFASPIDQIILRSFESSSIGEVAVQKINRLYDEMMGNTASESSLALIDEIGDVGLRNALIRAKSKGKA